jgi:CubicO group peptidase (beta-lactamase class C family)
MKGTGMTHSPPGDPTRSLANRFSRRGLLNTGGAALTVAAASTLPGRASAAQASQATPEAVPRLAPDAIDGFISETMESMGVPGASVAVVQGGQPVLIKGYGVRELGSDAPVDTDTAFQLASNTKPMTAFVLGTLIEEGHLDWDTPIVEVLPELQLWDSYPTRFLTSRDVLAHRSGFPAFGGDLLAAIGYDRAELLRRLRFVPPAGSFREVAAYSNLGFFIAGEVISRLTGAPWEEAMRERLFTPLGMPRSGPALSDRPADGNMSANHGMVDGTLQVVPPDDHGVHGSAGSAISTASDLARWMQALLDGGSVDGRSILQPDTVREMILPSMVSAISFSEMAPIDEHSGFAYGLGWANYHYRGHEVIEKGGALDGIRTVVCFVPALNAGVAVAANLNLTALPEAIRGYVLEQLLGQADVDIQAQIRESASVLEAAFSAGVPLPESPVSPSVSLDAFTGTYENALYAEFRVIVEGDDLRLEAGSARKPATLTHYSHNSFLLDWGSVTNIPEPATFTIGPDGLAIGFETASLGRLDRVE